MVRGEAELLEGPPETVFRDASKVEIAGYQAEIDERNRTLVPLKTQMDQAIAQFNKIFPPFPGFLDRERSTTTIPNVLSSHEATAILSALTSDDVALRADIGPRSVRAFLFRYQLARLLLDKLQIPWLATELAEELARQFLCTRPENIEVQPTPPQPGTSSFDKMQRVVEQVC
jgi:hypothetical protein